MAIGFATIILFGRLLGPAGIGTYFFILAIVTTADGGLNGLIVACRKRIAEVDSDVSELLGVLVFVLGPLVLLVSLGVAGILWGTGIVSTQVAVYILIDFFPFVMATAGVMAIVGLERVDLSEWLQTGRTVFRVIIQLTFLAAGLGVTGLVGGHALAMLIGAVVSFIVTGYAPTVPSKTTIQSVWSFARYSVPSGIVARLDASVDEVFVGLLFVSATVGDYGAAARLVTPALLIPAVIEGSLSSRVSRLDSRGDNVGNVVRKNLAFAAVLAVPLFFGAGALGDHVVVTVFGAEFAGAAAFLIPLAGARVLQAWASPLTSVIVGLDRPKAKLGIDVLSALVLIVGAVVFAGLLGPVGIAFAVLGSVTVRLLSCLVVLSTELSLWSLFPRQVGEQLFAGLLMYLVVAGLDRWVVADWVTIVLSVLIGATVYGVALLIVSPETRSAIASVATNINPRGV
jgi:O-antigen/teichoic acid export membrane protein